MHLSSIQKLIHNEIGIADFKKEIADEVKSYEKLSKQKGATNPIFLKEDVEYLFTEDDIAALETLIGTNKINEYEGSYIADAILLSSQTDLINETLIDRIEKLVVEEW